MCVRMSTFLFIVLLLNIFRCSVSVPCILNIQNDLDSSKEPLILEADGRHIIHPLVERKNGVIYVNRGDEIILACPGKGNSNRITRKAKSNLKCSTNGKFSLKDNPNRQLDLKKDTSCQRNSACSSPMLTDRDCGEGRTTGKIVQLGFQVDDTWLPQVDICHNISEMFTLYSYHKLYGNSLDGAIKVNARKNFCIRDSPRRLFFGVNPETLFLKQSETLDKLLGNGYAQRYIQKDKVYFARGHLAPDADFIYFSEQQLTYNFINMAPQWQSFNNGNWKKLEGTIRKLAVQMSATFEVYTGTYGVMTLPDENGTNTEIYLEASKRVLPVPEVFWKIVHDQKTKSCTVAVGVNNVYLTSPPAHLCSPQQPRGLTWTDMTELTKGYLYFCNYQNFKTAVPYAPTVGCSSTLLQY